MQQPTEKPKKRDFDAGSRPLALAVDTSGRTGSVAIGTGEVILVESVFSGTLAHNAEMLPAIARLLEGLGRRPCDIGQVYLPAGPGSFTGLRIAVTFGKMFHYAAGAGIVAVNTLDALAQNVTEYITKTGQIIDRAAAVLDAKRGLFYIALFERSGGQWRRCGQDMLISADEFTWQLSQAGKPTGLLGEGLVYYSGLFRSDYAILLDSQYWPVQARCVYSLGRRLAEQNCFADPATLTPLYIRKPDVLK